MQTLFSNRNATLETVTNTFARLATSMTNSMRQNGYNVEKGHGLTYKSEVYIHVRLAWLTLPIISVLLSIVFLAVTMKAERQCRNLEVLKLGIAIPWSTGRSAQRYRGFDPTNGGAGQESPSRTWKNHTSWRPEADLRCCLTSHGCGSLRRSRCCGIALEYCGVLWTGSKTRSSGSRDAVQERWLSCVKV